MLLSYHTLIHRMHPLWLITIALCIGIALPQTSVIGKIVLGMLFVSAMLLSLCYKKKFSVLYTTLIPIAFLIGILRIQTLTTQYAAAKKLIPHETVTVQLQITGLGTTNSSRATTCITGTILKVTDRTNKNLQHLVGKNIQLFCNKPQEAIPGDIVAVQNVFIATTNDKDYELYLQKNAIACSVFLADKHTLKIIDRQKTWNTVIYTITNRFGHALQSKTNLMTYTLFSSLFVGDKSASPQTLRRIKPYFSVWGIDHYLARSGLHMALLASVWTVGSGILPISITVQSILLLFIASMYLILTQSSISFIRAFCLFFLYKTYIACNIQINGFHALSLVTIGVLFCNPFHLFFLDFQLSFFLTFGLIWFSMVNAHKKNNLGNS